MAISDFESPLKDWTKSKGQENAEKLPDEYIDALFKRVTDRLVEKLTDNTIPSVAPIKIQQQKR